MAKPNIPRCMSTQHPDNVNLPFFAESTVMSGEDEIQEAFYALSHLHCDEQMWDCEGKEVDNFVVKKLLTRYESYFREVHLGRDVFLTLRVPNPTIERAEAKILLETLESIPRSYDVAKMFYNDDVPPIFEVILPMTTSAKCVNRIYSYYRDYVVGKQHKSFREGDITIAEWIGEFKPDSINVIPLFEDMEHMLEAHNITRDYLRDKRVEYQRVFLARSDPAMNYGLISAVLLNKIALQRLHELANEISVDIYPIVGVGSAPFRGDLQPSTVEKVMAEYPSAYTFTIQSALKYDNSSEKVRETTKKLKEREVGRPQCVDEEKALEFMSRYCREYQKQITVLAPVINRVARYVPSRRKRKLHVGLFGYSRSMGDVTLPRVITFTAALYSVGLPPELLGLNALSDRDYEFVREAYINFDYCLADALKFYNPDSVFVPKEVKKTVEGIDIDYELNDEHKKLTDQVIELLHKNQTDGLDELILRAGNIRKFLG